MQALNPQEEVYSFVHATEIGQLWPDRDFRNWLRGNDVLVFSPVYSSSVLGHSHGQVSSTAEDISR